MLGSVAPSRCCLGHCARSTILPLAPGRFSTTTDWPKRCCMAAPRRRASRSIPPPGGVTTMVMGFSRRTATTHVRASRSPATHADQRCGRQNPGSARLTDCCCDGHKRFSIDFQRPQNWQPAGPGFKQGRPRSVAPSPSGEAAATAQGYLISKRPEAAHIERARAYCVKAITAIWSRPYAAAAAVSGVIRPRLR